MQPAQCGGRVRPVDEEIDVLEARLADAKRRKLAQQQQQAGGKCPMAGGTRNSWRPVHRARVECAKSAKAPKAHLDCEEPGRHAEFEQTFKVMRDMVHGDEGDDSLRNVAQAYMTSMQAFVQKQAERAMTTSLSSNTVKGDRAHAQLVREQYSAAHTYLMEMAAGKEREALSLNSLFTAHRIMMQGLCADPGRFRRFPARCGNRIFVDADQISSLMEEFLSALQTILCRQDLSMWGKAAWACAHLLAIHPFTDGNGRLARLLANWVLISCGLPFTVVLCSSDAQRAEYIEVSSSLSCPPMSQLISAAPPSPPAFRRMLAHAATGVMEV